MMGYSTGGYKYSRNCPCYRCETRHSGSNTVNTHGYPIEPPQDIKRAVRRIGRQVAESSAAARDLRAAAADYAQAGPDAQPARLAQRESNLMAEYLDRLDTEHPSYAVTLPAELRSLPWHSDWAQARRKFITSTDPRVRDGAYRRMLTHVTADSPPLASDVAIIKRESVSSSRMPAVRHFAANVLLALGCTVTAAMIFTGLWLLVLVLRHLT